MSDSDTKMMIPAEGWDHDKIFEHVQQMRQEDTKWKEGRTWSLVYYVDEEHHRTVEQAYCTYFSENYLNPFAFSSLKRMEEEVIAMAAQLMNGSDENAGTMTSGGTESIFMAVYTYRERARKLHPNIKAPEIVVAGSIHPAFEKAAHMLNVKLRKTAVDKELKADPAAMEKAIGRNTILLVGSAPSYPHGIMDPIPEIAALAQRHQLPMHVDGCIGGFMLPWVERLGYEVAAWDFRIPGVTSISADVHKFGYSAKGASVLLYRNMDYLKYQFYIATEWSGGIYASPTLLGTRPGGAIAAAWASLKKLGQNGYLEIAREIMDAVAHARQRLTAIQSVQVLGDPIMNIVAYNTINNTPDIFLIADQLEKKGWMIDRQQFPNCIHMTIMRYNIPVIDNYLDDLEAAIAYAQANPKESAQGNAALYGMMARVPFRGMVERNVRKIFEQMYSISKRVSQEDAEVSGSAGDGVMAAGSPAWMGTLNRLLNGLSKLRYRLRQLFR